MGILNVYHAGDPGKLTGLARSVADPGEWILNAKNAKDPGKQSFLVQIAGLKNEKEIMLCL